jgi:CubicO group peptidase (beta-lactamase class C family)
MTRKRLTTVHGTHEHRFSKLAGALAEELSIGGELGAAIAIDVDGEMVVDMWGGYMDAAKTIEWQQDTIINLFSNTKALLTLAALILVERGLLDLSARVSKYWPEFAVNGKQHVKVRHILGHTSGVSGWDAPWTIEEMYDLDKSIARLANQTPWWPPGTASGYHVVSQGHLLGEVIRRITGETAKKFVRDEIAEPLGADIHIGASAEHDQRIAEVIPPPSVQLPRETVPQDHPMRKTLISPPPDASAANTLAWRRAELGGANGHGNARSLARALSPISLGGKANGVQLLTPTTIEMIFHEQANGVDQVLAIPLRWGTGFALPRPETLPYIPDDEKICFWGGWGGSIVLMNPDRRTTIAYTMNKMGPGFLGSERTRRYVTLIYEALA